MYEKLYGELTPNDLAIHPVWEFALDKEQENDTLVRPVIDLPVDDLGIRVVGTKVHLANGSCYWALIDNLDPKSAFRTRHLMSLTLMSGGQRIFLARYHDPGQRNYGPEAFARKLGLEPDQVFPISYDVSSSCVGDPAALVGTIESDPKDKLSEDEIFQLIVGKKPAV